MIVKYLVDLIIRTGALVEEPAAFKGQLFLWNNEGE
jgi:hypothetical protein